MKRNGSNLSPGKSKRKKKPDARVAGGPRGEGRRLDPDVERWFAAARAEFPSSRSSIIPMLQAAQKKLGYLPRDAMQAIASHVVAPPAVVEGVASFYAQFRFSRPGRHRVTVCTGTACYVRGSGKLLDDIKSDLKIASGETTADGAVSLESVSCFGACALAPIVILDDKVLRQQTSDSVKKVIRDISADPPKGRRRSPRSSGAAQGANR